jgi:hypothetical protein
MHKATPPPIRMLLEVRAATGRRSAISYLSTNLSVLEAARSGEIMRRSLVAGVRTFQNELFFAGQPGYGTMRR